MTAGGCMEGILLLEEATEFVGSLEGALRDAGAACADGAGLGDVLGAATGGNAPLAVDWRCGEDKTLPAW